MQQTADVQVSRPGEDDFYEKNPFAVSRESNEWNQLRFFFFFLFQNETRLSRHVCGLIEKIKAGGGLIYVFSILFKHLFI